MQDSGANYWKSELQTVTFDLKSSLHTLKAAYEERFEQQRIDFDARIQELHAAVEKVICERKSVELQLERVKVECEKQRIKDVNGTVDQYERLLKHEITRYDRLTKAQQNSIDQLETQLSNTEQRLANARSEQNSLLKQEIEDLKRQNLTLEATVKKYQEQITSDADQFSKAIERCKLERDQKNKRQLEHLKVKTANLLKEQEMNQAEKTKQELIKELLEQQLASLTDEHEKAVAEMKLLRIHEKELNDTKTELAEKLQKIKSEYTETQSKHKQQMVELEEKSLRDRVLAEQAKKDLLKKLNEIKQLENDRRSLLDRLSRSKDQAEKLQSQLTIIQAELINEKKLRFSLERRCKRMEQSVIDLKDQMQHPDKLKTQVLQLYEELFENRVKISHMKQTVAETNS